MKEQFYQELLFLAPDAESAHFLLAVSGGRDSVVLAHLFANYGLNFDVAHCNFHLRGGESNKEMFFVQNLPFLTTQKVFVKEFNTMAIQQKSGKSIEMVARELRYQWFEEIGENYDYIVTAHHANDNTETVLMNLLRGTGLRGMCGIPQKNGKIIRPLLRFSNSVIERYVREQEIDFCIDSSNLTDEFLRNKIRHHVIPELEKINPNFIEIFSKNSNLFLQQTKFFDAQVQQYKKQLLKETEGRISIPIDALKDDENRSLILYEILNPFGFNADDVENILKSIDATPGKQFLSDTHILIKDRTHFIIEKKEEKNDEGIIINSIEELEKYGFLVEKISCDSNFKLLKSPNVIYVDTKKLIFPLTIRNWKKGDYFYPFGMKTKKKLSDFFTDLKVDLLEKQKIRLLCSGNQIVWIINYRADDRFRIDEKTEFCYSLTT
ncbi:MAG: tRNA lysidine(34) synthetase TilS [Bacteroidetes bacterium]|nr:tRNA lysidine(34) synthetase TilS [Bacteroidota bacterium]MCL2303698.1 tRNA lysidine(34) synthetase TilS [Lentimicrobiaceae bacterium]